MLLPWLLVVLIALDDAFLLPRAPNYGVLGLLDEPAHLATSVILLLAVTAVAVRSGRSPRPGFVVGLLLAGNLIDLDHVPELLGSEVLTAGTPRPYTHSLTLLLLVVLTAFAGRGRARAVAVGVALGLTGHFLRDLGTAPIALFWPVSTNGVTIPHTAYLLLLGGCALVPSIAGHLKSSSRGADTSR